jgi:hypothetical protein
MVAALVGEASTHHSVISQMAGKCELLACLFSSLPA